ncbi:unnamed protein product [Anisakis simplex]|uniref:Leukocyte receptor cluster member 8 (inferred by orthology to a human protein) n=1 Tax=Anisakis simplex TaxID=6269 RepID=A0A0M3K4A0_ANISI|nr:unnamed protein product [Anisakis simplex]
MSTAAFGVNLESDRRTGNVSNNVLSSSEKSNMMNKTGGGGAENNKHDNGNAGGDDSQTAAWLRAQEALKKVNPAAAAAATARAAPPFHPSFMNPASIQAATTHYYPWTQQYASFNAASRMSAPVMFQPYYNPYGSMPNPFYSAGYPPPPAQNQAASTLGTRPNRPELSKQTGNNTKSSDTSVSSNPSVTLSNQQSTPRTITPSAVMNQRPHKPINQQNQQPIRFSIGRFNANPNFSPNTSALPKNNFSSGNNVANASRGNVPDSVRRYIERAYSAVETKEERDKLEEYLRQKLNPLLTSGAARAVDWDKEPLPSDVNFELKNQWTPASELRRANASVLSQSTWKSAMHDRNKTGVHENKVSATYTFAKDKQHQQQQKTSAKSSRRKERKRRNPSPTIPLYTSSEEEDDGSDASEASHGKEQRKSVVNTPSSSSPSSSRKSNKKKCKKQNRNGKSSQQLWIADERSNAKREERARRFGTDSHVGEHDSGAAFRYRRRFQLFSDNLSRLSLSTTAADQVIVGTCTDIEKSFFRLTSVKNFYAPDPSTVRPLEILEKALKQVQRKYASTNDYLYANDQLKSIRQDLMIQCIRNEFTVKVYETNARIAIERGDREEFNQCQSQLKLLYTEVSNCANKHEFTAYRLLYYISVQNTIDQITLLSELDESAREDECIAFALRVRQAWALGNFVRLFKLYANAPRMTSYVMDLFIERERKAALNACLKSYRPSISVSVLSRMFVLDEQKITEWLNTLDISVGSGGTIDCRLYCNTLG